MDVERVLRLRPRLELRRDVPSWDVLKRTSRTLADAVPSEHSRGLIPCAANRGPDFYTPLLPTLFYYILLYSNLL
jgi:hypothetical protein